MQSFGCYRKDATKFASLTKALLCPQETTQEDLAHSFTFGVAFAE